MNKNFIGILFSYTVLLLVAFSIKFTVAFYSDIEQSLANVFSAGVIDLQVANADEVINSDTAIKNSTTTWDFGETIQKFFDFSNIKPSDFGSDTIKLRIQTNPAWICAKIHNIVSDDATNTEPELLDDTTPNAKGELDLDTVFIFYDDANSNNNLDNGEKVLWQGKLDSDKAFAIADSQFNLFSNDNKPLEANKVYKIKKAWCLGTFENGVATCNGRNLNNRTQGDTLTADITFFAVQSRHNDNFVCETTPKEYQYYNCDKTNYTCGATDFYKSKEDCIAKTGGDCYATTNDCATVCQKEKTTFYKCNKTNYTCDSNLYDSIESCQANGDTCYAKQDDCSTACVDNRKKYYTCNTDCYTCDQTADGYESLTDCQTATGKACYESTTTCGAVCKLPTISTQTFNTLSGQTGLVEAIARYGNNNYYSTPSELLLNQNGITKDSKELGPWQTYLDYTFVIERLADGTITYNVTSTNATNKLLTFKPVSSMGSKLIVEIVAPISGFSLAEISTYQKGTCAQRAIGQSISINNCSDPCVCDVKYKRMEITGLDFSNPFKVYGKFRWGWPGGHVDTNTPSMAVKFK